MVRAAVMALALAMAVSAAVLMSMSLDGAARSVKYGLPIGLPAGRSGWVRGERLTFPDSFPQGNGAQA